MKQQSTMSPYLKEALIGIVSASGAFIVVMALLDGGNIVTNFEVMRYMLFFFYVAPFISILVAPWLLCAPVFAGIVLYLQYKYVPSRFGRYLVFADAVAWQALGLWCANNVIGGWLSGR